MRWQSALLAGLLAWPTVASAQEVELGGFLETNHFLGLKDAEFFDYGNTNILGIKLESEINEQLAVSTIFELRHNGFTDVATSSDLGERSSVEPVTLRLDEAYIDYFGFGLSDLDLRVGKQHIVWGTADGFNPTSYLAPHDLENPLEFDSKMAVTALQATYFPKEDLQLVGVVVPLFTPSLLPTNVFAMRLPVEMPEGVVVSGASDELFTPSAKAKNIQAAAKLGWKAFDTDMSISYFTGRYNLPVLKSVDASSFDVTTTPIQAELEARLGYSRTQAVGADLARSVSGILMWAEGAVFFPNAVDAQFTILGAEVDPLTGQPLAPIRIVDDKPYLKAVVGLDYTFKGGYYFNFQYLRGFFNELTADALQDYLIAGFRKKLFEDAVEIELIGGGEYDDKNHLGWIGGAEVRYIPFDAGKVTVGALVARGDEGTTFDLFSELDQAYLRFRADF